MSNESTTRRATVCIACGLVHDVVEQVVAGFTIRHCPNMKKSEAIMFGKTAYRRLVNVGDKR